MKTIGELVFDWATQEGRNLDWDYISLSHFWGKKFHLIEDEL